MVDLANDPRAVETTSAGGNNSIISALSGASNSAPTMSAPPPAPSATPAPQQAPQGAPSMDGMAGIAPQGAIDAATGMGNALYGRGFLQGGEQASNNAIQQLFQYDQMLDKGYSPFPNTPGYVENPADLYGAGASFAGGIRNVQGQMNQGVSTVESGYQAAISGLLDKFTSFYKMKQDEEEARRQAEKDDKRDAFETSLMIAKLVGGKVRLPDGREVDISSDFDRELSMTKQKKLLEGNGNGTGGFDIAAALAQIRAGKSGTSSGGNQPTSSGGNQPTSSGGNQPTYSGTYTVKDKKTGLFGSLPSTEYDPSIYEFIQ